MSEHKPFTSLHIERLPLGGYVVCQPSFSAKVPPALLAAFSEISPALAFVESQMDPYLTRSRLTQDEMRIAREQCEEAKDRIADLNRARAEMIGQ